jgi:hypothetical protein
VFSFLLVGELKTLVQLNVKVSEATVPFPKRTDFMIVSWLKTSRGESRLPFEQ